MIRALITVVGLVVLGACGQVPRPFEHAAEIENDLLVLGDRAGIVVAPLAGNFPADRNRLAQVMAARLRDLNIPATTDAVNDESRYLHGWAAQESTAAAPDLLVVQWELWDLDGRLVGSFSQREPLNRNDGTGGGARLIDALATEAAPKIAALVQEPAVNEASIPGFPGARLVVAPLGAGPGDSAQSLAPALRAALSAAGFPVSTQRSPRDILILGKVALGPAREGVEEVAITWSVVTAQDSEELGRVDQLSQVPEGSLDGSWGPTATEVARGAVQGIIDLLNRAATP